MQHQAQQRRRQAHVRLHAARTSASRWRWSTSSASRKSASVDGKEVRTVRINEEVINVATIQGVFGKEFQTTGLESLQEADRPVPAAARRLRWRRRWISSRSASSARASAPKTSQRGIQAVAVLVHVRAGVLPASTTRCSASSPTSRCCSTC